jgi:DNA-binding HxlR family transcriptional regulator
MVKAEMREEKDMSIEPTPEACAGIMLPIRDALDILHGKWKLPIIASLLFGNRRFKQMANEIPGITDKMLSKELKDLEMNHLITRTVYDEYPPRVEYSITAHGLSLRPLLLELKDWGSKHRKEIMGR